MYYLFVTFHIHTKKNKYVIVYINNMATATEIPRMLFYNPHVFKELDLNKPAFQPGILPEAELMDYDPADVMAAEDIVNNRNDDLVTSGYTPAVSQLAPIINSKLEDVFREDPRKLIAYGGDLVPFVFGTNSSSEVPLQRRFTESGSLFIDLPITDAKTHTILNGVMAVLKTNPKMCTYGAELTHPLSPTSNSLHDIPEEISQREAPRFIATAASVGKGINPKYVIGHIKDIINNRVENEYFIFMWDINNQIVTGFMYFELVRHENPPQNLIHRNFNRFFHITAFCGNIPHNARGALLMPAMLMKVCRNFPNTIPDGYNGIILDSVSILSTLTLYNSIGFQIVTNPLTNHAIYVLNEILMVWCVSNPQFITEPDADRLGISSLTSITKDDLYNIRGRATQPLPPEVENAPGGIKLYITTEGFPDNRYSYIRTGPIVYNDNGHTNLDKLREYGHYLALSTTYDTNNPLLQIAADRYLDIIGEDFPRVVIGGNSHKYEYRDIYNSMKLPYFTKDNKILSFILGNPAHNIQFKSKSNIVKVSYRRRPKTKSNKSAVVVINPYKRHSLRRRRLSKTKSKKSSLFNTYNRRHSRMLFSNKNPIISESPNYPNQNILGYFAK